MEELIKQAGVVAVPGYGFFHTSSLEKQVSPAAAFKYQSRYIRFAFCKSEETLALAAQNIARVMDHAGRLKLFQ